MLKKKKKIALLFPAFMGGGAESVCAWMLQALKDEYDVTLVTLVFGGLKELNRLYGTNISDDEIHVKFASSRGSRWLLKFIFFNLNPFYAARKEGARKHLFSLKDKFDLFISAFNETDLPRPGIQYIHRFNLSKPGSISFREQAMQANLSLANSKATAEFIKERYKVNSRVVYPPVLSDFPAVPWEKKENGFVIIGRLCAAKSPHIAINILKQVRNRGLDVHLHIIGSEGEIRYLRFLEKLCRNNASWVILEKNLNRERLAKIISEHKYGIHWKQEPFGIVVAEVMKSGGIPFVRDQGGQVEIVGGAKDLMFGSEQEAVEKITSLLSDNEKEKVLLDRLSQQSALFSEQRFMAEIRQVVKEFLEKDGAQLLH